jgi:hypothetical protein
MKLKNLDPNSAKGIKDEFDDMVLSNQSVTGYQRALTSLNSKINSVKKSQATKFQNIINKIQYVPGRIKLLKAFGNKSRQVNYKLLSLAQKELDVQDETDIIKLKQKERSERFNKMNALRKKQLLNKIKKTFNENELNKIVQNEAGTKLNPNTNIMNAVVAQKEELMKLENVKKTSQENYVKARNAARSNDSKMTSKIEKELAQRVQEIHDNKDLTVNQKAKYQKIAHFYASKKLSQLVKISKAMNIQELENLLKSEKNDNLTKLIKYKLDFLKDVDPEKTIRNFINKEGLVGTEEILENFKKGKLKSKEVMEKLRNLKNKRAKPEQNLYKKMNEYKITKNEARHILEEFNQNGNYNKALKLLVYKLKEKLVAHAKKIKVENDKKVKEIIDVFDPEVITFNKAMNEITNRWRYLVKKGKLRKHAEQLEDRFKFGIKDSDKVTKLLGDYDPDINKFEDEQQKITDIYELHKHAKNLKVYNYINAKKIINNFDPDLHEIKNAKNDISNIKSKSNKVTLIKKRYKRGIVRGKFEETIKLAGKLVDDIKKGEKNANLNEINTSIPVVKKAVENRKRDISEASKKLSQSALNKAIIQSIKNGDENNYLNIKNNDSDEVKKAKENRKQQLVKAATLYKKGFQGQVARKRVKEAKELIGAIQRGEKNNQLNENTTNIPGVKKAKNDRKTHKATVVIQSAFRGMKDRALAVTTRKAADKLKIGRTRGLVEKFGNSRVVFNSTKTSKELDDEINRVSAQMRNLRNEKNRSEKSAKMKEQERINILKSEEQKIQSAYDQFIKNYVKVETIKNLPRAERVPIIKGLISLKYLQGEPHATQHRLFSKIKNYLNPQNKPKENTLPNFHVNYLLYKAGKIKERPDVGSQYAYKNINTKKKNNNTNFISEKRRLAKALQNKLDEQYKQARLEEWSKMVNDAIREHRQRNINKKKFLNAYNGSNVNLQTKMNDLIKKSKIKSSGYGQSSFENTKKKLGTNINQWKNNENKLPLVNTSDKNRNKRTKMHTRKTALRARAKVLGVTDPRLGK